MCINNMYNLMYGIDEIKNGVNVIVPISEDET